jgi:hypothetical protein
MAFLLAGKSSGRTTLTVIDQILHTRLPKTHVTSTFEEITRSRPRTFLDWTIDHAAEFQW